MAKVTSDKCSGTANILFNEGAQRSFISKRLAPYRQESVLLASFRVDTSAPQQLDVTNVTIISYTGEMIPLSVLVVLLPLFIPLLPVRYMSFLIEEASP